MAFTFSFGGGSSSHFVVSGYHVDPLLKKGSVFTLKNRSVFHKVPWKKWVFGVGGMARPVFVLFLSEFLGVQFEWQTKSLVAVCWPIHSIGSAIGA